MTTKPKSYKALKSLAEKMIVEDGLTAKEVNHILGVSEQTLSKWRKGNPGGKSWDERQAELMSSPHKIKDLLLQELKLISEGKKPNIDADALAKVSKVIESVSGKVSVQVIFSVFKEFDNWMADQDPKVAILFTDYHKLFLIYKANQEG